MADQWYYRFMDQEMGPVDLLTLRTLAADGALGTADEVRRGANGEWRPAESVEGLFPEAADAGDLLGMLESESAVPVGAPSRGGRGTNCYCRLLGVEMGPMTFEQLASLASAGRLNPQDDVRLGATADWIEAGSIVGLFPGSGSQAAAVDAGAAPNLDVDDFELKPAAGRAVHATSTATDDGTRVWYCKVLGQEIGPATFEEVHAMIADGQLSRTDELRHGRRGDWMPADSIVGLFPEEEAPVDEYEPEPDETEPETEEDDGYKFDFEDFVGDKADAKPQRGRTPGRDRRKQRSGSARPTPERTRPAARRDAKPKRKNEPDEDVARRDRPTPAPQAPLSPPTPRPTPVAPAPYPPAAAARTAAPFAAPARPVPAAVPKPRRAMGNPFAGIGSAVGGLFRSVGGLFGSLQGGGGLGQSWKPLAAAVVLGAVAYLLYFGSPFSSSRAPEVYRETLAIWEEVNRLKESPGEWSGFKEKTMPRVEQLGKELAEEASSRDRLMQLMLYCHRDCLPQIFQSAPDPKSSKWAEMNDYMEEAKRLAPAK
jgi:hypothetical protein